jgi:hypothetical protein
MYDSSSNLFSMPQIFDTFQYNKLNDTIELINLQSFLNRNTYDSVLELKNYSNQINNIQNLNIKFLQLLNNENYINYNFENLNILVNKIIDITKVKNDIESMR